MKGFVATALLATVLSVLVEAQQAVVPGVDNSGAIISFDDIPPLQPNPTVAPCGQYFMHVVPLKKNQPGQIMFASRHPSSTAPGEFKVLVHAPYFSQVEVHVWNKQMPPSIELLHPSGPGTELEMKIHISSSDFAGAPCLQQALVKHHT